MDIQTLKTVGNYILGSHIFDLLHLICPPDPGNVFPRWTNNVCRHRAQHSWHDAAAAY